MKKSILGICFLLAGYFVSGQAAKTEKFCSQLQQLVESAAGNLASVKGQLVKEKIISWGEKEYYKTNVLIDESQLCYITTGDQPVYKAVYFTDVAATRTMLDKFDALKIKMKSCLGDQWKYIQNNSSDFFFSSSYVAMQSDKDPEVKLAMYDNGTGMVVLELQVVTVKH